MTDNLFEGCETIDEILALVLDAGSPEALQGLLDHLIETETLYREDLELAAERMATAGLPQATIILEATAKARSQIEVEIETHLADPVNGRSRLASMCRRGQATLEQMEACGADTDTLEFVAGPIGKTRATRH